MTLSEATKIHIDVPSSAYDVYIGFGLFDQLETLLDASTEKVLLIFQPTVKKHVEMLHKRLKQHVQVFLQEVPDAEAGKTVQVAQQCWQTLGLNDFTRTDVVFGIGGGAVTDLAGFVAANWLRGVGVILVPTSVLAMVDAAIGGKTGVNTAEGKNLVGSFYAPKTVLCDMTCLETLPFQQSLFGSAEIIKYGFIADPKILEIIEEHGASALDVGKPFLRYLVESSVSIKANIVGADFKENAVREVLNYGHTLGHAIEHREAYRWSHGAAVSVGMMFAAHLSHLGGLLDFTEVERHKKVLSLMGLPVNYPHDAWESLIEVMRRDKKTRGNQMRFIVLEALAKPTVFVSSDWEKPKEAYERIATPERQ